MATFRERALAAASSCSSGRFCVEDGPISTYFGQNVFTLKALREALPTRDFSCVPGICRALSLYRESLFL